MPTTKTRAADVSPRKAAPSATVHSSRRTAVAASEPARTRSSRPAPPRPADGEAAAIPVMHLQIAECAYYRAEARSFAPGHELDDWLEAERALRAAQAVLLEAPRNAQGTRRTAGRN